MQASRSSQPVKPTPSHRCHPFLRPKFFSSLAYFDAVECRTQMPQKCRLAQQSSRRLSGAKRKRTRQQTASTSPSRLSASKRLKPGDSFFCVHVLAGHSVSHLVDKQTARAGCSCSEITMQAIALRKDVCAETMMFADPWPRLQSNSART